MREPADDHTSREQTDQESRSAYQYPPLGSAPWTWSLTRAIARTFTSRATRPLAESNAARLDSGEQGRERTVSAANATPRPTKPTAGKSSAGFTAEERAAIRERAKEAKAGEVGESEVLAKINEMTGSDRTMAERIHAIVKAQAPGLSPRTWYGQPAYAKGGKVVCFFQPAAKFKTRYATFGFSDEANLDEGVIWPTSYALKELNAAGEKVIADLVRRAAS
jgi:uncharacterized protein YdhG (YjbR/CyaY superfamily)